MKASSFFDKMQRTCISNQLPSTSNDKVLGRKRAQRVKADAKSRLWTQHLYSMSTADSLDFGEDTCVTTNYLRAK